MYYLRIAFCFIMIIVLTACSSTSAVEVVPDYTDFNDTTVDFNGATFYFAPWRVTMYFPQSIDTATGDKMLKRYSDLEKSYNCTFTYIDMDSEAYDASAITKRYMAGLPVPDIIDREVDVAFSLYKTNFLASMDEISTINASDSKYGPLYFRSQSFFDGSVYGFCPYEWEWMPEIHGIILTNNYLIGKLGMSSPYDLIENDKWTWPVMEEQLRIGTVTDGDYSYTGMLVKSGGNTPVDMVQAAVFSNGGQMLVEKNGKVVFGMTSPEAIAALDYLSSLYEQKLCKNSETNNFINNEGPYYFTRSYEATSDDAESIPYTMQDFGLIPFPKGPNNDGKTGAYVAYDRLLYIVKMTNNDIDSIGKVIDFLFEPLDNSGGWKNRARQILHHDDDIDFYIDAIEHPSYNYQILLGDNYEKFRTAASNALSGKETSASAMQSVEEAINDYIAENDVKLVVME